MYELIILSLLMRQPAHGYLIGKVLGNIIGPVAKASNGRIYPLLAKLETENLISAVDEVQEGRVVRTYRITGWGKQRFRQLMLDTTSNPKEYAELFAIKVTVFGFLEPAERLHLIEHYIRHAQAHIAHLSAGLSEAAAADPATAGAGGEALRRVLQHRIDQWQLEVAWASSLRDMV